MSTAVYPARHIRLEMRPGPVELVVRLRAEDYFGGDRTLALRIPDCADRLAALPALDWAPVRGMELDAAGRAIGECAVVVRVDALRAALRAASHRTHRQER